MIEIIDCIQGSPEWHSARMGIPTASEFHSILAKGEGKTRRSYMLRLAGEILTGEPAETYSNGHMERGKLMEDEARRCYAFLTDLEPQRVGFVRNGPVGCSPDSLLGEDGLLEIKSALPNVLIDKILKDDFPPEHKAQCQGALWVCERAWVDIAIYTPGLPLFVKRATRDEAYIESIKAEVERFIIELAGTVQRVRRYRPELIQRKHDLPALAAG